MMRKIMAHVAVVAAALLVIIGCSKNGSDKDKIKIGFIVKQPEEPWFQLEWKFAQQAAEKHGFELLQMPAVDGEKVMSVIDNLKAKGAKGFVICTPDVRLGPAIKAKADKYGMKFMSVDDQFKNADGTFMTDVHHLGISAGKIGRLVGTSLAAEMKAKGWKAEETGVCVITYNELDTAKARTDGAKAALTEAGFPEDKLFDAPQKTTDVTGAFEAANILLAQQPKIKNWLICGTNDTAVLGAVRAMEGRNFRVDNVIGIGINGTDCISELEKTDATGFFGSVLLTPKRHGYDTAEMVYKWVAEGKKPPTDTRTTGILITRDNFVKILKEQGIRE